MDIGPVTQKPSVGVSVEESPVRQLMPLRVRLQVEHFIGEIVVIGDDMVEIGTAFSAYIFDVVYIIEHPPKEPVFALVVLLLDVDRLGDVKSPTQVVVDVGGVAMEEKKGGVVVCKYYF